MNRKIEKILDTVKDIQQARVKPYFYTRLSSKLEYDNNSKNFYLKYERPFLIILVTFLLGINLFFISNNNKDNSSNLSADINDFYFESNKDDIINFITNEE